MKLSQVAAQLFTVRDHCKTAADLAVSIRKLKAIGYAAVQVSGVGPIPEDEIVRICSGEGVAICATHEPGAVICDDTQKVIDRLGRLGCRHTAYPWPHTDPKTEADTLALAAKLDAAGAKLRAAGQVLCYHNHAIEFRKVGTGRLAKTMLETIYDATDAKNLQGEPDMYWVQAGGGDPVAWARRLHQRMPLIHLKDYGIRAGNDATMMEIGSGVLNWPAIIDAAERSGCQWFIVEQDTCPADPFDSLAQSFAYIRANLAERA